VERLRVADDTVTLSSGQLPDGAATGGKRLAVAGQSRKRRKIADAEAVPKRTVTKRRGRKVGAKKRKLWKNKKITYLIKNVGFVFSSSTLGPARWDTINAVRLFQL
jgi:hypothetical protein